MSKRKNGAEANHQMSDDLALLGKIAIKGQPIGPLSVAKQKKLLRILMTEMKDKRANPSGLDFESFRMGFLAASVVVRMFLCTGGGQAYDEIINRLGVMEKETSTENKEPAKA